MLAVQDRIDKVQLTIEELTAQLKSLRETTTYGTLSVYVSREGPHAARRSTPATPSAARFWNSIDLLGRGVRVTALVLTALLPFIVVFGAIGAGRLVRRAAGAAEPAAGGAAVPAGLTPPQPAGRAAGAA